MYRLLQRGIVVTNTPGAVTEATADLTWGLLLSIARRIPEGDRYIRAGKWNEWKFMFMLGGDVYDHTLGIIGMGRIGQAVARRAQGFGMRVLYHPMRLEVPLEHAPHLGRASKPCCSGDLSVMPLTAETTHRISEADRMMQPTGTDQYSMVQGYEAVLVRASQKAGSLALLWMYLNESRRSSRHYWHWKTSCLCRISAVHLWQHVRAWPSWQGESAGRLCVVSGLPMSLILMSMHRQRAPVASVAR